jgi:hypothetical protein
MQIIGLEATLPQIITGIGGLGTAAFGIVDASKGFGGSVNHIGFAGIRNAVKPLTPEAAGTTNTLAQLKLLKTLEANWMNGTDLGSQKSIAKSLIKLNLNVSNAPALAAATGVDVDVLKSIAAKIAEGTSLSSVESDVFGRFDLIVTALLDEAYQRSDQVYRNWTRMLAAAVAIALAIGGGFMINAGKPFGLKEFTESLIVGLLATPLAPIAKDVSSALATAVNTMQLVNK